MLVSLNPLGKHRVRGERRSFPDSKMGSWTDLRINTGCLASITDDARPATGVIFRMSNAGAESCCRTENHGCQTSQEFFAFSSCAASGPGLQWPRRPTLI